LKKKKEKNIINIRKKYNKFKANENLKDKHLLILDKYDFKEPFLDVKMKKPK